MTGARSADAPTPEPTVPSRPPAPAPASEPLLPTRSADDSDTGWERTPEGADDHLLREVPPHW